MNQVAVYFGCGDGHSMGHHTWTRGMRLSHDFRPLEILDGQLAPGKGDLREREEQFIVQAWRLPEVGDGWSAISWWDRTVDKRGKSNSTLFAPGLKATMGGMQTLLERDFPKVVGRAGRLLYLPRFKVRGTMPVDGRLME